LLPSCRKNTPGALVLVDGQEITRERKLLAWAADMSLQRSELRRTRMELAQAREEIRVLRAELSVLRMEVRQKFSAMYLCENDVVFVCDWPQLLVAYTSDCCWVVPVHHSWR
jgi:hypothetical protein